jgi:hypothetical protein
MLRASWGCWTSSAGSGLIYGWNEVRVRQASAGICFSKEETRSRIQSFFYEMDMNSVKFYLGMIVNNFRVFFKKKHRMDAVMLRWSPYSYYNNRIVLQKKKWKSLDTTTATQKKWKQPEEKPTPPPLVLHARPIIHFEPAGVLAEIIRGTCQLAFPCKFDQYRSSSSFRPWIWLVSIYHWKISTKIWINCSCHLPSSWKFLRCNEIFRKMQLKSEFCKPLSGREWPRGAYLSF